MTRLSPPADTRPEDRLARTRRIGRFHDLGCVFLGQQTGRTCEPWLDGTAR